MTPELRARRSSWRALAALAAGGIFAQLSGCILEQSNRGTVVDNEVRVGSLYYADGSAAANARVRVYPVGHQPDTAEGSAEPAFATVTDGNGEYRIAPLPEGEYNILGEKDGTYSLQDSVFLGSSGDTLAADTLDAPGSVSGVVGLQPNHNPVSVLVQVLGTNMFANVGEDGRFRLANLAEGKYTLRLVTTLEEYSSLIVPLRVVSGRDDTLPDTLRLPFFGIPVVTGLRAEYDTAEAVVRLSWDSARYRDFSEYLVYRDSAGVIAPSTRHVGSSERQAYADTLLRPSGGGLFRDPYDSGSLFLEYRVRIRNKSDQVGLNYGKLRVEAVGPGRARLQKSLQVRSVRWDSAMQADRVVVTARLRSPTRGLKSIRWSVDGADSLAETHALDGIREIEDSLAFHWAADGPFSVRIRAEDMSGSWVEDMLRLPGNAAPVKTSDLPAEHPVSAHVPVSIAVPARDPDNDTLSYSIRNKPAWMRFDSATATLSGTPTNADSGRYEGIRFLVSDGRRTLALPAFAVTVKAVPWVQVATFNAYTSSKYFSDGSGRIYFDEYDIYRFDPATGSKERFASRPTDSASIDNSIEAVNGGIYFLGGSAMPIPLNPSDSVWALDTATRIWSRRAPMPVGRAGAITTTLDGKIYVIGGDEKSTYYSTAVTEYDVMADSWVSKKPFPFPRSYGASAIGLGGKIYTMGWTTAENHSPVNWLKVYDPVSDAWADKAPMSKLRTFLTACAAGGKIYVTGGNAVSGRTEETSFMEAYDPVADSWARKSSLPQGMQINRRNACAEWNGNIYFFLSDRVSETKKYLFLYHPALDN